MPIRVVVGEDHLLVREGIRYILQRHPGIELVGEAGDGEEAVALVCSLRPDVVLMDVAMPRLNGIEAARRIRALHPRIAVLMLTAYDDDAYVFASLEAGAAGYLLKNAPPEQLLDAIQSVHNGEAVLSPAIARKVVQRFAHAGRDAGDGPRTLPSERELAILRLAAGGLANRAIADAMGLSPRTVQMHLQHVFEKLEVGSRTQAVVEALRHGWIRIEEIGP